eukprot:2487806-Ditylum_brightwellii.AAC.1
MLGIVETVVGNNRTRQRKEFQQHIGSNKIHIGILNVKQQGCLDSLASVYNLPKGTKENISESIGFMAPVLSNMTKYVTKTEMDNIVHTVQLTTGQSRPMTVVLF